MALDLADPLKVAPKAKEIFLQRSRQATGEIRVGLLCEGYRLLAEYIPDTVTPADAEALLAVALKL